MINAALRRFDWKRIILAGSGRPGPDERVRGLRRHYLSSRRLNGQDLETSLPPQLAIIRVTMAFALMALPMRLAIIIDSGELT